MNRLSRCPSLICLILLTLLGTGTQAVAAPGSQDLTFNGTGMVTTAIGSGAFGRAMVVQPDGKILVAGHASNGTNMDFALVRYLPDGTLDNAFGTGGRVVTSLSGGNDFARAVALQTDGKILVGGSAFNSYKSAGDFAVVRYFPNGSVDTSFGYQGKAVTSVGNFEARAYHLAVNASGAIFLGGYSCANRDETIAVYQVVKYDPDGDENYDYGNFGEAEAYLYAPDGHNTARQAAYGMTMQGGKVVLAGTVEVAGTKHFAIYRFNHGGENDSGFGNYFHNVTFPMGTGHSVAYSVLTLNDGKLLVAGSATNGANSDFALARLMPNGALDPSFGVGGKVTTQVSALEDYGSTMAVQKDGRILVVGRVSNGHDTAVAMTRYLANGSLDNFFGTEGKAITDLSSNDDNAYAVAILDNGKILVAGETAEDGVAKFFLARFDNSLGATVTTTAATGITAGVSATLNGLVNANESSGGVGETSVSFVLNGGGLNQTILAATPATVTGSTDTPVSATVTGLSPGTTYSYRVVGANGVGLSSGETITFTTQSNIAGLAGLAASVGTPNALPGSNGQRYQVSVPHLTTSLTLTPLVQLPGSSVSVNGAPVESGSPSGVLTLGETITQIAVVVTAPDGVTAKTFAVTVLRQPSAPGDADLTFNAKGWVRTLTGTNSTPDSGMAVQSDGKVVMVGTAGSHPVTDFCLLRFNIDGTLDTNFGVGGKVLTDVGAGSSDFASHVAVQTDGKIVVAGHSADGASRRFAVVRYLADGSLDGSFGAGGKTLTDAENLSGYVDGLVLQPDGKIVVGGGSNTAAGLQHCVVIRYTPAGALDTTFSGDGRAFSDFAGLQSRITGLALQKDGKIIGCSQLTNGAQSICGAVRFNANGTLDTSFSGDGMTMIDFEDVDESVHDLAIQEDGKIVIVGSVSYGSDRGGALVRLRGNGSLDSTFGEGGGIAYFSLGLAECRDVAVQSDGKLVVCGTGFVGSSVSPVVVARFQPNGSLDAEFGAAGEDGHDGVVATSLGGYNNVGNTIIVQADSTILVGASSLADLQCNLAVLRFHGVMPQPEMEVYSPVDKPVLDGDSRNFGSVDVGQQRQMVFSLRNAGNAYMAGLAATIDGVNAPLFSLAGEMDGILMPGETMVITVLYTPVATGKHEAVLHLHSNDADEASFEVRLTATAVTDTVLPVTAMAATNVTALGATLNGSVDPKGWDPEVLFEYGTTINYGSEVTGVATESVVAGRPLILVHANVTDLLPHTKYFYRLKVMTPQKTFLARSSAFTTGNRVPVPVVDEVAIVPGCTVPLDVLSNDTDADGDTLSLVSYTTLPALQGKLAKVGGELMFAAASGFSGAHFTYVAKDGYGGSAPGSVTLTLGDATIEPQEKSLAAGGGSHGVSVAATGAWSATESLSWVTVARTGDDAVQVTVHPNSGKVMRRGTVMIAGKSHVITQEGVREPELGQPAVVPEAIVSGTYALEIPTVNPPVTYVVTGMPPGLTMNQTTGWIRGKPTKAGVYHVTVKAKNAAGTAQQVVELDIDVAALPEEVVGTFHGYVERDDEANDGLGSRFEMTTAGTGAVSGKVITGTTALVFKGVLDADASDPQHPELTVTLPRKGKAALKLELLLAAGTEAAAGTISDVPVSSWRQVWKTDTRPATAFKGMHTFCLTSPIDETDAPQGYGFGAFTVDQKSGMLKMGGKLADGSTLTTSTFVGAAGQVLVYQSLYGNKGSFAGTLTVAPDHTISGAPEWYKPASAENSKDTVYRQGFGPFAVTASGGSYTQPPPGGVLMAAAGQSLDAVLEFEAGGFASGWGVGFDLQNPALTGMTQKALFPADNPNRVKLTSIDSAKGTFAGEFILPGATVAQNRKTSFQGQFVGTGAGMKGFGYFLLPQPAAPPLTLSAMPKHSGRVILRPASAP